MNDRPRSLKAENAWLIRTVLLLHALAFAYFAFGPSVLARLAEPDAVEKLKLALAPGSLSLAIIVLAKLMLLGLVPARLRDRLIHWRWKHPLPGSRAFSRFAPADARVDLRALEQRYGSLPTDPNEQDRLFYKVYRAHKNEIGVLDAHKSYLATRDIGIINLILFVLLPGLSWWATGSAERAAIYTGLLLASYLVSAFAAQVYASRFVENVLAAASASRS